MTDERRREFKKMTLDELRALSKQLRQASQQLNEEIAVMEEEIRTRREGVDEAAEMARGQRGRRSYVADGHFRNP
jgi:hypothetical protein